MINPKELRLGNWVNYIMEDKSLPDTPGPIVFSIYSEDGKNYNPIPLSPEVLEKCGFEEPQKNYFVFGDYSIIMDMGGWIFDYVDANNRGDRPISYPESLHQLQNLYFALTGKELNYQP